MYNAEGGLGVRGLWSELLSSNCTCTFHRKITI